MKKSWRNCTQSQLMRMDKDSAEYRGVSIQMDSADSIFIYNERTGDGTTIPRRIMNRLVDEYLKEREVRRK